MPLTILLIQIALVLYPLLSLLCQAAFAVRSGTVDTPESLVSIAITLITSIGISYLSIVEHRRTTRPSTVVIAFLLVSSTTAIVWWTIPVPKPADTLLLLILTCQILVNLLMLANESYGKQKILTDEWCELSDEETSGLLQRALFSWIAPILAEGYRIVLVESHLPRIHSSLSSRRLRNTILEKWHRRGKQPLHIT